MAVMGSLYWVTGGSHKSDLLATHNREQSTVLMINSCPMQMPLNADAVTKITAYEKEQKYQEELLANIKARTGKTSVLPELKSSPKVEAPKEVKKTPKAEPSFKLEAPVSETPKPSLGGQTAPAAPVTAPPSTAAATPEAAESGTYYLDSHWIVKHKLHHELKVINMFVAADNKGLIAIGGIALVAVAGLAASSNQEETMEASPAGASASTVPPNVAEARAWIAAWKKKYNKP